MRQLHTVTEEDHVSLIDGKGQRTWDEHDREHWHQASASILYLRCSNGHVWRAAKRDGSSCQADGCDFEERLRAEIDKAIARRFGAGGQAIVRA